MPFLGFIEPLSVIVDDLDIVCVPIIPGETYSPLFIDSDAVLAPPIAAEKVKEVHKATADRKSEWTFGELPTN